MADLELLKKVPLTCEVMAQTKLVLENYSEESGISIGNIIDRLAVKLSSTNSVLACQLVLETLAIAVSTQDNDGAFETIIRLIGDLTNLVTKMDNYQERLEAIVKKLAAEHAEGEVAK